MIKLILAICLASISGLANAVPNFWSENFSHGYNHYVLTNNKNQKILVKCNSTAAEIFDHSVVVTSQGKEFENNDEWDMEFLLDGQYSVEVPGTTDWRSGANAWDEFREKIAVAKKIDVFYKEKKIASFLPNVKSVKNVASGIADCMPMSYRDYNS